LNYSLKPGKGLEEKIGTICPNHFIGSHFS